MSLKGGKLMSGNESENINDVNLISCQKCGKPVGIFTNEEIAAKISELKFKPYKFLCETCKKELESKFKENNRKWISYQNSSRQLPKQKEAIADIIKEWSFIKPSKEEEMAIKMTAKQVTRGSHYGAILMMYENNLKELLED